jgi:hypothetical protein
MVTVNRLIQYLTANNNIGRQNPITAGNLANHFGISDGGVQVEMINVIRDAIDQIRQAIWYKGKSVKLCKQHVSVNQT